MGRLGEREKSRLFYDIGGYLLTPSQFANPYLRVAVTGGAEFYAAELDGPRGADVNATLAVLAFRRELRAAIFHFDGGNWTYFLANRAA